MMRRSIALALLALLIVGTVRAAAPVDGFDEYVVSLLHFNGSDGSTTFSDATGRTWTAHEPAQLDTAQSVFGGASGLFTDGGYISSADDAAWQVDGGSSSGKWTIDMRVRFDDVPSGVVWLVTQRVDADNAWGIYYAEAFNGLGFTIYSDGEQTMDITRTWDPAEDSWAHVTLVHGIDGLFILYVDGGGASGYDTTTIPDFDAPLYVGGCPGCDANSIWIDELRISTNVTRWTGFFAPPSYEYSAPMPTPSYPSVIRYGDLGDLIVLLGIALVLVLAFIAWIMLTLLPRK